MPPETVISTLRHAHTKYNADKRYAGTIDVPLSEDGVRDAQQAATSLARAKFEVVVTSMQARAFHTAKIISAGRIPIVRNPLCNERRFGVMEGLTWDEVQALRPPVLMISVGGDLHTVNPTDGEPFEAVWVRAQRFRRFLFREYRGKEILVVSHGVFLQMFHGALRGLNCIESLARYPANLELFRFLFAGRRLVGETVERLSATEGDRW